MNVVTRFAPSLTGYLHIGGARTAIFNYLFAKKHSGKYLVRIEDTDEKRSSKEAINAIHKGLNWLNVNSEHDVVYQSQNFNSHIKVAHELLKKGYAYKCYLNSDELKKLRIKSRQNGIPIKSPWRNKEEPDDNKNKEFVIRLKMPSYGTTTIDDIVQGKVTVKNEILDDMVILRSDNTPTYMLSSVVDDNNMGITHIIRGDDHFNNAFRQIQIIKYLNVDIKELKKSAMDSIKNNEAVWFGCDVGKRFSRDMGVLDMGIYDYENVFQTSFKMNKQTRLEYGDSEMTHAMLLTGVDIKKRNSTKWKIENSRGTKSGNQGYMMMTDEWFDEYTYEVVIDKKYLNKRLLKYLDMEPVALAPWDPMGALAR